MEVIITWADLGCAKTRKTVLLGVMSKVAVVDAICGRIHYS